MLSVFLRTFLTADFPATQRPHKKMKTGIVAIMLGLILFSSVSTINSSHGSSEEYVTASGYLNVRELVYFDGSLSYDYILMSDNDIANAQTRYILEFENEKEKQVLSSRLADLIGSSILIEGFLQRENADIAATAAATSVDIQRNVEERINVKMVEPSSNSDPRLGDGEIIIGSSLDSQPSTLIRTLNQVVAPARYADIDATPHSEEYYLNQFYTEENYSLAAYWEDASYGKLVLEGKVTHWVDLPRNSDYYLDFGGREADLVAAIDSQVDFDGPDNGIQNASPQNVFRSSENDDVDSVIGIYNGLIGTGIAGYGYLEPISISTGEGSLFTYFTAIVDTGAGSPEGVPSDYFVGLAAHEMGHNLGWYHTATPYCVFCDPWSLMSGGIYNEQGPSGPIAAHRESEGWIEPEDVFTLTDQPAQGELVVEFTLDILGQPTGQNYLVAKVPFGSSGHYYTIEARKNVVNDHTPLNQTGLVVYHYSPTGHADSMEQRSTEMIIDTTKIGDLANADIDVGDSFEDLKNKITITNLAQNEDSIIVKVIRGDQSQNNGNNDCSGKSATILGTYGPDILEGTSGNDIISGLGGDDVIYGLEGNDVICGGWGSDTIEGGVGDDLLFGNRGNDVLVGGDGNDNLVGGVGDDKLEGNNGNDELFGWSDNDELLGGSGNDSLYGGDGNDYLLGGAGKDTLAGWLGDDTYADKNDATVLRTGLNRETRQSLPADE